jgi:hypothetical protein
MHLAISACREERSDRVRSRSQMSTVKEANEGSYCDVTGETDILHVGKCLFLSASLATVDNSDLGDIRGYKIYMAQGE